MQRVTGTLSQGAHPGSYNGQDAYNDMLVVGNGLRSRKRSAASSAVAEDGRCAELYARSADNFEGGGSEMNVRRLTPEECEALQGYPTGYTDIGDWEDSNGKVRKTSDSARYRALGNSLCLPFWFYLMRRISAQYERPATLGSLFDGIGGFPLCWERCNGKGTAVWASEIDEYCTAVTKKHFE